MGVTYEQARDKLAKRLSPDALDHSERVAATAVSLAALYGVDEVEAALGGLLHDWHREASPETLVTRARELGLDVTEVDEAVPYLLHGPLAEADLAEEFPELSPDVRGAVGAHTYGAQDMTPLAMIVYLADVLEPSRGHEGVQELRSAAGVQPLEDLFVAAYARSLHHLVDTRRRIHPQTVATWNHLVSGTRQ